MHGYFVGACTKFLVGVVTRTGAAALMTLLQIIDGIHRIHVAPVS